MRTLFTFTDWAASKTLGEAIRPMAASPLIDIILAKKWRRGDKYFSPVTICPPKQRFLYLIVCTIRRKNQDFLSTIL
jgi:hypothetical protein